MNLRDYKKEDIEAVLELKKAALGYIEDIETAIWTDDLSVATGSTLKLYEALQRVRVKKDLKSNERNMELLVRELQRKGISIKKIKKADRAENANRLNQ